MIVAVVRSNPPCVKHGDAGRKDCDATFPCVGVEVCEFVESGMSSDESYPVSSMVSGAIGAVVFVGLFCVATLGSVFIGRWVSGYESSGSIFMVSDSDVESNPFVICFQLLLVMIGQLSSGKGLLIGLLSFISLVTLFKSYRFKIEALAVLYFCGLITGINAYSRDFFGFSRDAHGGRMFFALVIPAIVYLIFRLPLWIYMARQKRAEKMMDQDEDDFSPELAICPMCQGRLLMQNLVSGSNKCSHCGAEFEVEEE